MVKSQLSLKYLSQQANSLLPKSYPHPFQHESHNYDHQASNILDMEKRYEIPLKPSLNVRSVLLTGVSNHLDGQSGLLPQQVVQAKTRHEYYEI